MRTLLRTVIWLFGVTVVGVVVIATPWLTQFVGAATSTLTVDGSQHFQTITGLGASINSHSWNNGALKPVLDKLIDQNGTKTFRVVMEMTDWEATNDDASPSTFNWAYYDPIYSGATTYDTAQSGSNFGDLWNTIDYLHQRGIPDNQIILSFMGPGPSWLSGSKANMPASMEDEWVETVLSAAYYGYSHGHTFGIFSPNNEQDLLTNQEGIAMTPAVYAASMNKLAGRMDTLGMNSVRLLGPETSGTDTNSVNAMASYPALMAKVDHMDFHNYSGTTDNAKSIVSTTGKDFWISEFSIFDQAFALLNQNASGIMMWDAYDSVYNHAILNGHGTNPGNDAGNAPSWIAYNATTKVYTPRQSFYQFAQLFKYVSLGAMRIGTTTSSSNVTTVAFKDSVTGRLTIVGQNTSSSSQTLSITLNNVGALPNILSYYQTNSSNSMAQGADVPITSGTGSITVPANTVFTLTSTVNSDTQAPTIPVNVTAGAVTSSQVNLTWDASTDDVGVAGYVVKRNGLVIGQPTTTSYTDSTASANTMYLYTVAAKDSTGNVSADSQIIYVTTPIAPPDAQAPTIPASMAAVSAGLGKVTVTWSAASDNVGVTGYTVLRNGVQIATTAATSFTDSTVSVGATYSYTVQANDAAGNASASSAAAIITVPTTFSIWPGTTVPGTASDTDASAVEVGMKFRSDVSGKVNAIRFYKGTQNTGTHVGHLWSSAGAQLATVTFTGETASGWQQASLSTPVAITANTTYVVSYYAPVGRYAGDNSFFATKGVDNAPLHALANGVDGTNGLYRYGSGGGFPTSSYQSSNYWVDVLFTPDGSLPADTTSPTLSITTPTNNTTVSGVQNVTITAADNVGVTKVEWYLDGILQATKIATPYSFTWNTGALTNGLHQLTAKAYDGAGNVGSSTTTSITVFNDSTPPSTPDGLVATTSASAPNKVDLSWNASSDDVAVTGYVVKRDSTIIAQPTATNYSDLTVSVNTTYLYTVYAVDAAGNQSPAASASVTTPPPLPDTQAPTVPGSLSASNTTANSTKLSWSTSTDNVGVAGYQLLRDGTPITTTTMTSYSDSGLQSGTTYSYTVRAYDAAGNYSIATSPVSITTTIIDTIAPQVSITTPSDGVTAAGSVQLLATATDNIGVVGVQFKLDGVNLGAEITTNPYGMSWNSLAASNGTHIVTAIARDAAGNTTTSTAVTVTVNNPVSQTPIATDVTTSTHSTTPATTIASPAFTTNSTNELLVAFISADGPSGAQTIKTVTGGSLTWTLQKRSNTRAGTSEIWTASTPTTLTGVKVTATLSSGSYIGSMTIVSFTNAKIGGASASANAASGAPSISLTTAQAGSQVWAVGNDWDSATARTVGSGQTLVDQYLASVGDTFWVQRLSNPVTMAGTVVTLNATAPTADRWNLAAIEIVPNP